MNLKALIIQTRMALLSFSQRSEESTRDPGETAEQWSSRRPPREAGVPGDRHASTCVLLEEGQRDYPFHPRKDQVQARSRVQRDFQAWWDILGTQISLSSFESCFFHLA